MRDYVSVAARDKHGANLARLASAVFEQQRAARREMQRRAVNKYSQCRKSISAGRQGAAGFELQFGCQ